MQREGICIAAGQPGVLRRSRLAQGHLGGERRRLERFSREPAWRPAVLARRDAVDHTALECVRAVISSRVSGILGLARVHLQGWASHSTPATPIATVTS